VDRQSLIDPTCGGWERKENLDNSAKKIKKNRALKKGMKIKEVLGVEHEQVVMTL